MLHGYQLAHDDVEGQLGCIRDAADDVCANEDIDACCCGADDRANNAEYGPADEAVVVNTLLALIAPD